ncbi:MAG: hypothetical protein S4CHLAM81_07140 [Chlamydiales bacterium]|nr:hypothetical protein [Chlamydiales bacterium]MCH9635498.1 hypothetical protein [Chlamydiales bacterium]MCH9703659.1 hypothetical protein [Chlamydiota bacterium]
MLEEIVPMEPLHFFDLEVDVNKEPTLLPDLMDSKMAKVYMWWAANGLHFRFQFRAAFDQPHPRGDCVELMIDTRNIKSSSVTRFCHHFLIFPRIVDGEIAKEITRFRTEERHNLASPDLFKVKGEGKKLEIFIPKEALHGYDPQRISKLGFNYKIQEVSGEWQVFSASPDDFVVEQHPLLWATINLESK